MSDGISDSMGYVACGPCDDVCACCERLTFTLPATVDGATGELCGACRAVLFPLPFNYPVGSLIHFTEEKNPYRVRAASPRFLICTKPFGPRKAFIYCIVDRELRIRGPDNMTFSNHDYADQADIDEAMKELEAGELEVSYRRKLAVTVHFPTSWKITDHLRNRWPGTVWVYRDGVWSSDVGHVHWANYGQSEEHGYSKLMLSPASDGAQDVELATFARALLSGKPGWSTVWTPL